VLPIYDQVKNGHRQGHDSGEKIKGIHILKKRVRAGGDRENEISSSLGRCVIDRRECFYQGVKSPNY
jgi:hypothetical protein